MNYQLFVVSEGSPKTVVELMDGHGDHQLGVSEGPAGRDDVHEKNCSS